MPPAVQGRAHLSAEGYALLKEKGNSGSPLAQVPDVPSPLVRHGPEVVRVVPTLAAHDDSIESVNVVVKLWSEVLE
jgi:hypothetical protein